MSKYRSRQHEEDEDYDPRDAIISREIMDDENQWQDDQDDY